MFDHLHKACWSFLRSALNMTGHSSEKRTDGVLKWDEYFMGVAFLSAQRSKDPNTQVGACIVNAQNRIVGTGYNGMPNGLDDDKMPWGSKSKYYYVCHAELNAIVNKFQADVRDCRMYVSLYPCNECAKLIVQSGIKEVIYFSDKYHDTPESEAARDLLKKAGVTVREAFSQNQNQCRGGCQHAYDHSTQTGFLSCSNSPGTDAEQPK